MIHQAVKLALCQLLAAACQLHFGALRFALCVCCQLPVISPSPPRPLALTSPVCYGAL